MIARGLSRGFMFRTKSSSVLNTRVPWYADTTNESHFFCRTAVARSIAGSIKATTLRRGPSLLFFVVHVNNRGYRKLHILLEAERVIPGSFVGSCGVMMLNRLNL